MNVVISCQERISLPKAYHNKIIYGYFVCSNNMLTSLRNSPREVNGYFSCSFNELTSLKDCPKKVKLGFFGQGCLFFSLDGLPIYLANLQHSNG